MSICAFNLFTLHRVPSLWSCFGNVRHKTLNPVSLPGHSPSIVVTNAMFTAYMPRGQSGDEGGMWRRGKEEMETA